MIGKTLGHYKVTDRIGAGGTGMVYKARDTHLDRFAAIKVLPPGKVSDSDRKRRFIQEAKAASALNHPSIITIYDIDQAEGVDYIAMEFVPGKTLDELIPRKGMRLSLALKYAVQIADALARAHGAGIIHRDLKPSNVMVNDHGLVKVLDFGLAKVTETVGPEAETAASRTGAGAVLGTAAYMSPEQAEGKQIDTHYDIFIKLIGAPRPLRLTTDPAWDGSPAFSPDGRSVAFVRVLGDRIAIMLIPAIGGPERTLAAFQASKSASPFEPGFSLAWFPDGKWIATDGLALISVETGEIRKLTSLPTESYRDITPAISPDGHAIAFSHNLGEFEFDIYRVDLTPGPIPKGEPRRLTFMKRQSYRPTWTADGRDLIFTAATLFGSSIWRIAASGSGNPRPLLAGSDNDDCATTSRQGDRLVFSRRLSDINTYRLSLPESGVPSGPPVRFLYSSRDEFDPKYSRDGRLIAFESNRAGAEGIWMSGAEGANAVEVCAENGRNAGAPHRSPDGQHLTFDFTAEGSNAVYAIRVSGGKPFRFETGSDGDSTPSWSHAGSWICFCSLRSGQRQIWKVPAGGGEAVRVTDSGGNWPVESSDGKSLYFMRVKTCGRCQSAEELRAKSYLPSPSVTLS